MKTPTDLEIFMNSQSADITVCQIALQTILLQLLQRGDKQRSEQAFRLFADDMLGAIDNTEPSQEDPAGHERHKQLTLLRGERFLQEVAVVLNLDPATLGRRGAAN